jgi:hypothetical protein
LKNRRKINRRPATTNLQELCDKGVAKAKRNPSQSIANGMEICIAWIYQSRYIKKEERRQKKRGKRSNHENTKIRRHERRGLHRHPCPFSCFPGFVLS